MLLPPIPRSRSTAWVLVVVCGVLAPVRGVISGLDSCTASQQREILPQVLSCGLVETVVHLDLPNDTFIHVVPNHVTAQRCGGSCLSR